MSHDLLDDLLADVPRHVVPDAGRAWRVGAARRRRRHAAEGLAVAATVVIGLLAAGLIDPPDPSPTQPADKVVKLAGHPSAVEKPFVGQPLPDVPGVLAGTVQTDADGWYAVDQNGRSWALPTTQDGYPALSDDGTRLGQLVPEGGISAVYETEDLTTGKRERYPSIGSGVDDYGLDRTPPDYFAAAQQPAYWSPDGARLVVPGGRMDKIKATALLLEDGDVTPLDVPGYAVGWVSPTSIAWLTHDGGRVLVTDLAGAVLREVSLQSRGPMSGVNQWRGRVSPDGTSLAVLDLAEDGRSRLWAFSLMDGAPLPDYPRHPNYAYDTVCPISWHADRIALGVPGVRDVPDSADDLIDIGERWGTLRCGSWAAEALAGPAQPGPGISEWRYWSLWWHWWQLLIALGVGISLVVALRRWLRRRPVEEIPTVDWWGS